MSIIQISKIQQRSGDLVDLPQLDEAEFGFASDVGRLFVGKTSGEIENIEVLTAYSNISFSQIEGANSNLAIDGTTLDDGQVLVYDGSEWTNRGGNVGGLIDLGHVSNVVINGGGINYVLTTDGTGNLSWTPKNISVLYVKNISQSDPGVVTTTENHFLINGIAVTFTGIPGMTELNGSSYYAGNLTANTFSLYEDVTLSTPVDTSAFDPFPYTIATATTQSGNIITVNNGSAFTANMAVQFVGNTANTLITANTTYYIKTANSTAVTVSTTPGGANIPVATQSGLSLELYGSGGTITFTTGGSEGIANAAGSNQSVQFNYNNLLEGSANFKFDFNTNLLTLNPGNFNLGGSLTANGNVTIGSNLAVNGSSNLNSVGNVTILGGLTGQVLTTYGNGALYWSDVIQPDQVTGYYLHTQQSASSVWVVEHNLNTLFVDATPVSATGYSYVGRYDFPSINYINANALSITFNSAITGYAVIVGDSTDANTYYTQNQSTGSSVWTINHNLNSQYVAVTPVWGNNNSMIGRYDYPNISYTNANSLTITFDSSQTGNVAVVGAAGSDGYYLHDQTVASATWTVNHNLNTRYVSITPIDSSGNSYVGRYNYPNVYYNNSNSLTLTFSSAVTGNVVVIGGGDQDLPAGGLDTQIQYNDSGLLTGSPALTFNKTSNVVTMSGNLQTAGIKTDNYYYANGTPISFGSYTNNDVANYLPTYSGIVGNGSATFRGATITTGAAATAGTITGNWSLSAGSRLESTYADLAEYYAADRHYPAGTVLAFGGEKEVTLAGTETNKVAGVVSADPAYVMNGMIQCEHPVTIALQGRVQCKVKGKVYKGDMMVSAGGGYAKAAIAEPRMGTVIGKALQNFDGEEGVIEVVVGRM